MGSRLGDANVYAFSPCVFRKPFAQDTEGTAPLLKKLVLPCTTAPCGCTWAVGGKMKAAGPGGSARSCAGTGLQEKPSRGPCNDGGLLGRGKDPPAQGVCTPAPGRAVFCGCSWAMCSCPTPQQQGNVPSPCATLPEGILAAGRAQSCAGSRRRGCPGGKAPPSHAHSPQSSREPANTAWGSPWFCNRAGKGPGRAGASPLCAP